MIKIIFLDLDGTLLSEDHALTEANIKACITAQKLGVKIVIATGRVLNSGIVKAKELELNKFNSYVVGNNGTEIFSFKENNHIFKKSVNADAVQYFYNWCILNKHKFQGFNSADWITNSYGKSTFYWSNATGTNYKIVSTVHDLIVIGEIFRLVIVVNSEITRENLEGKLDYFRKKFPSLDFHYRRERVFEVIPKGISKGYAVNYICNMLNISPNYALAIGDDRNDIEMLHAVKYGYTLKNAPSYMYEHAIGTTEKNSDSGVARLIKKYVIEFNTD